MRRQALALLAALFAGGCADVPHDAPPCAVRHWEDSMVLTYEEWTDIPLTDGERRCVANYLYLEEAPEFVDEWCGVPARACVESRPGGLLTIRDDLGEIYPEVLRHEITHRILKCVEGDSARDHEHPAFREVLAHPQHNTTGAPSC